MKLNLLYLIVLTISISCNGQTTAQKADAEKLLAKGDTVKELSNNIMVVYQDKKNNYWFGSWKDGLYKYDRKSIIHFTTKDGLPSNRVEEIKEDKQGNLYFNTTKGLCRYDGQRFLMLVPSVSLGNDWKLSPDALWFKNLSCSDCVYRLDGHRLYGLKLPKTKLGEDYVRKHPNYTNPYSIYCIYEDSKANIWFGTANLGVCRYNGRSFDWISESDVTEIHDGPANGVRSIAEDKNGDFWFNTEYRYSIDKQQILTKSVIDNSKFYERIKSIGCLDGKKDGDLNEYLSITKDNKNNLWIAIYLHGVWAYDGDKIIHYPVQVNAKNIPIYCIYKDNSGSLWLGTQDNGAFSFNGKTFEKFVL
jgi:ligand-binding sensor domain-containing protein